MPVRSSKGDQQEPDKGSASRNVLKRRYETPRLIDYGLVGKLTQTGVITTKDQGSMKRVCL